MIYLKFHKDQGLGNQLWNYVALRAICAVKDFEYMIINPKNFKGSQIIDLKYKSNQKLNFTKKSNIKVFQEKIFYDVDLKTFTCDFDRNILNIESETIINGLFQSEKYFFSKDINEFLKVKNDNSKNKLKLKNKCILNIRGGEYKLHKDLLLPRNYWINAMKEMKKFKNDIEFVIVTDDNNYVSHLFPDIEILKGDINNDFLNINEAEYLIVSNSSFAYFPIQLGTKPKKVIAPAFWARHNSHYNRWISPANYYFGWNYLDRNGFMMDEEDIKHNVQKTQEIYNKYNVLTDKTYFKKFSLKLLFPKSFRKFIKYILSIIFPLHIG